MKTLLKFLKYRVHFLLTIYNIKAGQPIYMVLDKSQKGFRKVKYNNHIGYIYRPSFKEYQPNYYVNISDSTKVDNVVRPATSSSIGGSVSVKGYYRKDGTYVRPHTRKAPKRR